MEITPNRTAAGTLLPARDCGSSPTGRVRLLRAQSILPLLLALSLAACTPAPRGIVERVDDNATIGLSRLVDTIATRRIIFIGEVHDMRAHHALQLAIIKALHDRHVPLAIGVEMFSFDAQPLLDRWVAGDVPLQAFVNDFREQWTIPWDYYDAIFLYARNNRIPLIALNVPRIVAEQVFHSGFASLPPEIRRHLPPTATCRIDAPYMEFVRGIYAHHTGSPAAFERFCEAQRLRNETMAWHLTDYHRKHPERTIVVLTGVGHAIRSGVPYEIGELEQVPMTVIVPRLSPQAEDTLAPGDVDYYVDLPPAGPPE